MTERRIGTREEWLAARIELLQQEKELTRRRDEYARPDATDLPPGSAPASGMILEMPSPK
jgi:predicted dithiol-disulfide oxidoreductase (DUF899 family)